MNVKQTTKRKQNHKNKANRNTTWRKVLNLIKTIVSWQKFCGGNYLSFFLLQSEDSDSNISDSLKSVILTMLNIAPSTPSIDNYFASVLKQPRWRPLIVNPNLNWNKLVKVEIIATNKIKQNVTRYWLQKVPKPNNLTEKT